jgi:N-glycosylase/DNA lyase
MWIFALLDYALKALVNYRLTPEGEREWNDFVSQFQADAPAETVIDPFAQPVARGSASQGAVARRQSVQRGAPQVIEDQPYQNTTRQE